MNSIKFIIVTLILVCFVSCKTDFSSQWPVMVGDQAKWLQNNAIAIDSISPYLINDDFKELMPLKELIGDSTIVLLGEQTHGDGSTFLAKSRIIKFLHQHMGFEVLAFESGFYDVVKSWQDIISGASTIDSSKQSIFGIWSYVEECQELFKYIEQMKTTENPLELTGFDCQFTGRNSVDHLIADLESMLSNHFPSILKTDGFTLFKDLLSQQLNDYRFKASITETDSLLAFLDILMKEIKSIKSKNSNNLLLSSFYLHQLLQSIYNQLERTWNLNYSQFEKINIRDKQMAENLIWLKENHYQNKKVIIWAATSHNIHHSGDISSDGTFPFAENNLKRMGQFLWEKYGKKLYSIGFTGFEGEYYSISSGNIINVPPASEESLEYYFNEAGFRYGLIDFKNQKSSQSWIHQRIASRPLGNQMDYASWPKTMDAMFFFNKMLPSHRLRN